MQYRYVVMAYFKKESPIVSRRSKLIPSLALDIVRACSSTLGLGPGWPLRSGWASKLNRTASEIKL